MKTFLSIGSGPGIGFATAERFAKEGFQIVLASRNIESIQALNSKLIQQGFKVEARSVDASDPAKVAALVEQVESKFGGIDVLHYNAASMRQATISNQPSVTFVSDLAINVGGALSAVQAVTPRMASAKTGTILLTGGGFALYPNPDYLSLSIGKAGIRALTLGTFESLKAQGIHIASVVVSTMVKPGSKEAQEIADEFWKLHAQAADSWTAELSYPPN